MCVCVCVGGCVFMCECDLETSTGRRSRPNLGRSATKKGTVLACARSWPTLRLFLA